MKLDEMVATMPYAAALGLNLSAAQPDEVIGSIQWTPERCTTGGVLHGGVLMTLADSLGAVCAFLNLPKGASTATIESKTNFFRAVSDGTVTGTTRPIHVGRSTIVVQTELRNDAGKLAAMTLQTQAVIT